MIDEPERALVSPLKWAGGKRWLAGRYSHLLPDAFGHYYEPFLGGAAIFISLAPESATLSDANSELINLYQAIKDNWRKVEALLRIHDASHSERYYYQQRAKYPRGRFEKAAWFLYMNRACYNGLYRVNKRGEFNVPKGSKEEVLLRTDDFQGIAAALKDAKLVACDFEQSIDSAREGDFVYLDPPYTVKHNNNGFTKYNEELFSWKDQERLAQAVRRAVRRGVLIAVSNADHSTVIDLYRGIGKIERLSRHSTIGGKLASRAGTTEIFVHAGY